ncbi:hypothetical protein J5N97_013471 [Dioscorea zingiberensis]|uniref:BHLH domain-containing protein n=1 Tax=Dioscorea zingiberensis TaxID=325984 RepID=A0A9D5CT20_9LILI|nr:hypothetical protein J5N97_013471 [Dioscorea zingiberensis]
MALSLKYPFMETTILEHHPLADMGLFHEQQEIYDELVSFCESFDEPDDHLPVLNSIFDPPGDIFSTTDQTTPLISNQQLPYSHTPCNEFNLYDLQSPKRLKKNGNNVVYDPSNFMYNDYSNVICNIPDPSPEFFMDYFAPPVPWAAEDLSRPTDHQNSSKCSNGCLSTQSMAARQRRKRISDKTQELGRLIPGGNKMNTAEMLQAAFKYVKFLQAQVAILGFINSIDHEEYSGLLQGDQEQLQVLLESPKVHEKLYVEEKCIVPEKIVENLLEDKQINLNRSVHRDLARFVETIQQSRGFDA